MTTLATLDVPEGAITHYWSWLVDPWLLLDDATRARLERPVVFVDVPEEFPRTEWAQAREDQAR